MFDSQILFKIGFKPSIVLRLNKYPRIRLLEERNKSMKYQEIKAINAINTRGR